jgi:hypothetical protein
LRIRRGYVVEALGNKDVIIFESRSGIRAWTDPPLPVGSGVWKGTRLFQNFKEMEHPLAGRFGFENWLTVNLGMAEMKASIFGTAL